MIDILKLLAAAFALIVLEAVIIAIRDISEDRHDDEES